MPIYKLKLISQRDIATKTKEFHFEKPEGFTFIPGQYGGFTLINPSETDDKGNTRRFSLLSTPNDSELVIAMRIQSSAYKKVLASLTPGDEVKFAGPSGNFILHEEESIPAVFIAGGIGITPFYSMIHDATQRKSKRNLILFYGNQTREDAALLMDLHQMQVENLHFSFIPTMTNPDPNWHGDSGFITHQLIKKYVPDTSLPIYYICGSPAMVSALHETLLEMGVAEEKIKFEDFPGY